MIPDHDRHLVVDYLSGKADALGEVDSWIMRIVRSRAWGQELPADDIIQECRLSVRQSLTKGTFDGRAPLRSYVSSIAGNICLSRIRKKYRTPPVVSIDAIPDPPDPGDDPLDALLRAENEELRARVAGAVMSLALPGCREVWRMVYYEKRRYEEIANLLSTKVGTVKSRVSRCKEKARMALSKVADDLGLDITEIREL
jgi:RNA polymerase sigma-70 factor (ECF subfamily)